MEYNYFTREAPARPTIRPLNWRTEEILAIAEINTSALIAEMRRRGYDEQSEDKRKQHLRQSVLRWSQAYTSYVMNPDREREKLLGAFRESALKGFIFYGPDAKDPEKTAAIRAIYVQAEEQGRGTGPSLYQSACIDMLRMGFESATIDIIYDQARVRRLSERMGAKLDKKSVRREGNLTFVTYRMKLEDCTFDI